jgi:hypothetical protein
MTFEEEFPSLKGKSLSIEPYDGTFWDDGYVEFYGKESPKDYDGGEAWDKETLAEMIKLFNPDLVNISDVQKHCLDKQRLKEAIEKIIEVQGHETFAGLTKDEFFKELGLK